MTVELKGRIFLGVVEDNNDPDRENKCKVRVINIFDGLPISDIPWATPWKDTDGTTSNLPGLNKIVSIEFENGDIYSPVYRYAEHHNINLENKLKELSQEDYLSMKALQFDHRTQIYSNEGEGLKLDHKYNVLNVTDNTINLELKSNLGKVNIGTKNADQQAILGNNFLDWFDDFISHLLGEKGGPYYGNLFVPVIPNPALITHLKLYRKLKDPKFLSHNVGFNDNGNIDKLSRPSLSNTGDDWSSTTSDRADSGKFTQANYDVSFKTHTDSNIHEEKEEVIPVPNNDGEEINITRQEVDPSHSDSTNSSSDTINADKLRSVMSRLGYIEKGYAISSGGDISVNMAKYAINVFEKIKEMYPDIGIRVTSGNDRFHKTLSYNSRHKKGNAIDFVITPSSRKNVENIENILKGFAANGGRQVRYLNEYNDPSRASTGDHFHLSWGLGTEGDATLDRAIADAKSGLIDTYDIV